MGRRRRKVTVQKKVDNTAESEDDHVPTPKKKSKNETENVTTISSYSYHYYVRSLRAASPSWPRNDRGQLVDPKQPDKNLFKWKKHLHPLLIPNVIANVMSRLEFSDLKNMSLVCKEWSEEGGRIIPKKVKMHLDSFEDLAEFLRKHEGDSQRNKYTHFRLGEHLNLQEAMVQRLFSKFGANMIYLHLDYTHFIPASLRKILFEKLPVLEEFIICSDRLLTTSLLPTTAINPDGTATTSQRYQNKLKSIKILRMDAKFQTTENKFLLELLSVMPNLEVISGFKTTPIRPDLSRKHDLRCEQWDNSTDRLLTPGHGGTDPSTVETGLLISKVLYSNNLVRKYKIKNLTTVFDGEAMASLRRPIPLPLQSLEIVVPSHTFSAWHPRPHHLFNNILLFAKTLKSLKVSYCSGKIKLFTLFDAIGRLRSLLHLTLHRVSGNLDYLSLMPQLKSLYMTQEEFIEYYDEFHLEECRPHKLEVLKLYYTNWSVSSLYTELPRPAKILNVVQITMQRFPNLKCLRIESLTDKTLTAIFTGLPQLEILEATNGNYTSGGISGIPVIQQGQCFGTDLRPNPHIGQLQKLKQLRLESNKLTDFGITSSVVLLPSLTHLTLLCYKLTDETLLAVVKQLELKFLKTEFCYEFSQPVMEWATKTLKERGSTAKINLFCGPLINDGVHEFLNENGPMHISLPDFPEFP